MINNRQAGRRRGRGGPRPQGNPGRGPEQGNRIDNRARGNASQLLEKYKAMARDAQMSGDRVATEYYHQFADHYFRVLAESRARFEENRRPRDDYSNDEEDGRDEQQRQPTSFDDGDDDGRRDAQPRDRQNYDRQAEDQQHQIRQTGDRDRQERAPRDRQDEARGQGGYDRAPAAATSGNGEDRGNRAPLRARHPRGDSDERAEPPLTLDADQLPPAFAPETRGVEGEEEPKPRRRGRPRRDEGPAEPAIEG